jgi:hypothetical protein
MIGAEFTPVCMLDTAGVTAIGMTTLDFLMTKHSAMICVGR